MNYQDPSPILLKNKKRRRGVLDDIILFLANAETSRSLKTLCNKREGSRVSLYSTYKRTLLFHCTFVDFGSANLQQHSFYSLQMWIVVDVKEYSAMFSNRLDGHYLYHIHLNLPRTFQFLFDWRGRNK